MTARTPGAEAVAVKGWWGAHKWLLARRTVQLGILGLFLLGPWAGVWIIKGTLSSSLTADVLPLHDPYIALQSLVAGHVPETTALVGALIVVAVYVAVGGRAYCSWVCPVNMVTDSASWLRRRLDLGAGWQPKRSARLWLLAATLVLAAATGTIAWELVNPVSMLHRGLFYGFGLAWTIVLAVFVFELFVSRHGWCGHLCPVGAFYGLLGSASIVRVSAVNREQCDDCMDCYAVCPEPQVIPPALKGGREGVGPVIMFGDCTNCARCIDVCPRDVYAFRTRFNNQIPGAASAGHPDRKAHEAGLAVSTQGKERRASP